MSYYKGQTTSDDVCSKSVKNRRFYMNFITRKLSILNFYTQASVTWVVDVIIVVVGIHVIKFVVSSKSTSSSAETASKISFFWSSFGSFVFVLPDLVVVNNTVVSGIFSVVVVAIFVVVVVVVDVSIFSVVRYFWINCVFLYGQWVSSSPSWHSWEPSQSQSAGIQIVVPAQLYRLSSKQAS